MSNLPEAVVERIQAEVAKVTGSTLGTIAAISLPTATVTVTLAGSAVAGIRCAAGYFPTVGDLVTVERVRDQLIASSKISKNLTAPPIPSLGTIAAINLPAATVSVSQPSGTIASVLCLAGYYPTVGDVVMLERIKDQWVVVGRVGTNLTAPPAMSLGTISAINLSAATVSVSQASGTVTGAFCFAGYYPTVGDTVVLERVWDKWVVQGRISKNLTAPPPAGPDPVPTPPPAPTPDPTPTPTPDPTPDPTPAPVPVNASVTVSAQAVSRVTNTTKPADSVGWRWATTGNVAQGRSEYQESRTNGVSWWMVDARDDYGALAKITPPTFPPGATITSAKIRITRLDDHAGALVSPTIYGHTLTGTAAGNVASYLHASYGPWSPGTLAKAQTGIWDLPSGWFAALLAGTLKGFGVWATTLPKLAFFDPATFCELTITYTYTP